MASKLVVYCDNKGATQSQNNLVFHSHMKKIEIEFVQTRVQEKKIYIEFILWIYKLEDIWQSAY